LDVANQTMWQTVCFSLWCLVTRLPILPSSV